ncbi:Splicing factor 3A subunit 2 [Trichoplax sp. H2]|nr:Splicing factor 3A subunit 2 [Trichoplax sp. H2]|eukprot:RDD44996.1 Splicing factor 3A subunit 2 [Trichoplax sp. H2]
MDFQHRVGSKIGSGGVASSSESNRDRRERLRKLALETIDLNKEVVVSRGFYSLIKRVNSLKEKIFRGIAYLIQAGSIKEQRPK